MYINSKTAQCSRVFSIYILPLLSAWVYALFALPVFCYINLGGFELRYIHQYALMAFLSCIPFCIYIYRMAGKNQKLKIAFCFILGYILGIITYRICELQSWQNMHRYHIYESFILLICYFCIAAVFRLKAIEKNRFWFADTQLIRLYRGSIFHIIMKVLKSLLSFIKRFRRTFKKVDKKT